MSLREQIAERLKIARKLAGLSQAQTSHLLGFDCRQTYLHLENAHTDLSAEDAIKCAEVFCVNLLWLLAQKPLKADAGKYQVADDKNSETFLILMAALKQEAA